MSNLIGDAIDFLIGILLIVTLGGGFIIALGGWSGDTVYLKIIGVILATGLTAVTLAVIHSSKK